MLPDRIELSTSPLPRETQNKQDQGLSARPDQIPRILHGCRVLVCGGRDYGVPLTVQNYKAQRRQNLIAAQQRETVHTALTGMQDRVSVIIHGDAPGADWEAGYWARRNGIPSHQFDANWEAYGRSAGPRRNQRMIDEGKPDLVIAFPGGRGTADMVKRARAAGIEVIELPPSPNRGD